jgi:hypothetical protein
MKIISIRGTRAPRSGKRVAMRLLKAVVDNNRRLGLARDKLWSTKVAQTGDGSVSHCLRRHTDVTNK